MESRLCEVRGCNRPTRLHCVRCGRLACEGHLVYRSENPRENDRVRCIDCEEDRRRRYAQARALGLRAILWSGAGGIIGSLFGHEAGTMLLPSGFAVTISTDVGFLAGLCAALFIVIRIDGQPPPD